MMVRPRWRGSLQVAPGLDDAGRFEDPGHQVVGGGERGVAGLVAGAPPRRHAGQGVEEPQVVGVEVDAARRPGRRSCPHATMRGPQVGARRRSGRGRARACPARSWWSSRRWRPRAGRASPAAAGSGCASVVSAGYRSPKVAMFASTVRSAAATAAAVASASELGRTSIAVMDAVLPRGPPGAGQVCSSASRLGGRNVVRQVVGRAAAGAVEGGAQGEAAVGPDHVEQRRGGEAERDRRAGPR